MKKKTTTTITRTDFITSAAPKIADRLISDGCKAWDDTYHGIKFTLYIDGAEDDDLDIWCGRAAELADAGIDAEEMEWMYEEIIDGKFIAWPGYADDSLWDWEKFAAWMRSDFIRQDNEIFMAICRSFAGQMYDSGPLPARYHSFTKHVTADTVLDYIRTYGPGELIHSDSMDRDCLCYTVRACADGTLAAPWEPYDKKISRHVWVARGSLNVRRPGTTFVGPDLNLNLICSLIADDINGWLDCLAYWGRSSNGR